MKLYWAILLIVNGLFLGLNLLHTFSPTNEGWFINLSAACVGIWGVWICCSNLWSSEE